MTATSKPSPHASTRSPGTPEPSPTEDNAATISAAQAAIAGEHACVYGYGVVGANLDGDARDAAGRDLSAHEQSREALREHIRALGAQPVAALPAYTLPLTVDDASSARELAAVLEQRLTALYVDLVGNGPGDHLRELATDALIAAANRAVRWGTDPVAFPGLQDRDSAPIPDASSPSPT